jgi:hypothetical protein
VFVLVASVKQTGQALQDQFIFQEHAIGNNFMTPSNGLRFDSALQNSQAIDLWRHRQKKKRASLWKMSWDEIKVQLPKTSKNLVKAYKDTGGLLPFSLGYVYLIHAIGSDFYKIGKSIKPDRRILQISPVMPFKIKFVRVWPSNFMNDAEKYLHGLFSLERVNGEWFSLNKDYLELILNEGMFRTIRHAGIEKFKWAIDWSELRDHSTFDFLDSLEIFDADVGAGTGINFLERIFTEILLDTESDEIQRDGGRHNAVV